MTTSTIRAALDAFQQAANRGTAIYLSPWLVRELRDALKAKPGAPADALAARPLLEQVAAMADCIGAQTVGQITAISNRAAAWLRVNPPGRPVAIEPRGCPTPGACSCVEPTPPAPEPGEQPVSQPYKLPELGEVPSDKLMEQWKEECKRLSLESDHAIPASSFMAQRVVAWARQQQATELATLRGVAVSEQLRIVKAGIRAGYNLGHHHTAEGGRGDPDEVADDIAQETLDDMGLPPVPQCLIARMAAELDRLQPLPAFPPDTPHPLAAEARAWLQQFAGVPATQAGEGEA